MAKCIAPLKRIERISDGTKVASHSFMVTSMRQHFNKESMTRIVMIVLIGLAIVSLTGPAISAGQMPGHGDPGKGNSSATVHEPEEHGLPQKAVEIARPFGFPITNSMVVILDHALGLILFARFATRDMNRVPSGAQNFLEWLVAALYSFLEDVIGPHLVKRTFWFFATIFIFILSANWAGLIPGVGTIGWGHQTARVS